MFRQCLQETSLPVVPQLFNDNNSSISKTVWIGIFLASCAVFGFHASLLVMKYNEYETAVAVHLDGINFIPPDVYVCNNNPISNYRLDYLDSINDTQFEKFKSLWQSLNMEEEYYRISISNNRIIPGYSSWQTFNLLSNRDYNDFITEFTNSGNATYSMKDIFIQIPHPYHFSCYKLRDEFKQSFHEKNFFSFYFYTDRHPFVSSLASDIATDKSDTSHTVYFTSPGTYPHYNSQKIRIEPGKQVSIQVSMEYYEKVNLERKPCLEKEELVIYRNIINENKSMTYKATPTDCAYSLMHQASIKELQCTWSLHPITEKLWKSGAAEPCSLSWTWTYASSDAADKFISQCRHKTPCKQPVYRLEVEEVTMRKDNIDMFLSIYNYKYPKPPMYEAFVNYSSAGVLPEKFRDSITSISIYAPNRFSTQWKEYLAYELKDLLSDVGGILGFYIGISVVTCLEIIGYASRIISQKRADKRKENQTTELESTAMIDSKV